MPARNNGTSTRSFGVGRRESHDASEFYGRFRPPEIDNSEDVVPFDPPADPCVLGDSRHMDVLPNNSVALVVTSPPYFVGKEYELDIAEGHVPSSYLEYQKLLEQVFAECLRKLEPGGRLAVNVANLGRKPYRSLSADVIGILQDKLGMLLRGEIIWQKAKRQGGSCAWGSFRRPTNPVLRDTSERIIVASKGRFDRAISETRRKAINLPHEATASHDEFLDATYDIWEIPPESATRVGHPAPFPVELPLRLIHLYTFRGDLVIDPFMGSGTTLVAALKSGRKCLGYDIDPNYISLARQRIREEVGIPSEEGGQPSHAGLSVESENSETEGGATDFQARASREGKAIQGIAESAIVGAGFNVIGTNQKISRIGIEINIIALDRAGQEWCFDVSGAFTTTRPGLRRTDTLWKALGRAYVFRSSGRKERLVLLTSDLPIRNSAGDKALHTVGPGRIFDAIQLLSDDGKGRLSTYAAGDISAPLPGFWSQEEIEACR